MSSSAEGGPQASSSPGSPRAWPLPEVLAGGALVLVLLAMVVLATRDVMDKRAGIRPLAKGDAAPGWELPVLGTNNRLSMDALRGQVVLVDFWATWCPPCKRELPELAALHQEFKDRGFTVVGINREPEAPETVMAFLREHPVPFPVVVDTIGVGERYRILSMPTSIIVDRQGRVVQQFLGYTPPETMREAVMKALPP